MLETEQISKIRTETKAKQFDLDPRIINANEVKEKTDHRANGFEDNAMKTKW